MNKPNPSLHYYCTDTQPKAETIPSFDDK